MSTYARSLWGTLGDCVALAFPRARKHPSTNSSTEMTPRNRGKLSKLEIRKVYPDGHAADSFSVFTIVHHSSFITIKS